MICSDKTKKHYNKTAWVYDQCMNLAGTAPSFKKILKNLDIILPDNPRILDIGCGTGLASEVLHDRFPGSDITGFDLSECMLERYCKSHRYSAAVLGDFNEGNGFMKFPSREKTSFGDGSFDLILSTNAVSEYGDLDRALPFIHRICSKKGYFINIGIKDSLINKFSSKLWKFKPSSHIKFIKMCRKHGFKDVSLEYIEMSCFPSNYLKYLVVSRK